MRSIITDIRSYAAQFTDWPIGVDAQGRPAPISPEDLKWTSVPIKVTLGGSNVDDDDDTYNGPANFMSLIFSLEAHIGLNDVSAESTAVAGAGNPTIDQRLLLKAQNYKVSFENADRSGGAKIFNAAKRLSSLLVPGGIWLPIPIIVPAAESLKVTIDSVDEDANVTGGSTDVGIDVWVLQLRTKT